MHHALGLTGRSGGVQDKQRIFSIHDLWHIIDRCGIQQGGNPFITAFLHCDCRTGTLYHQHFTYRRTGFQCLINNPFQVNLFISAIAAI
ncbi:hypothetical protein D9M68_910500 [compost metagenome]